jgi:hypothetical protein
MNKRPAQNKKSQANNQKVDNKAYPNKKQKQYK